MDTLVDDFTRRRATGLEAAYALWSRDLYGVARHALADSALAEDCVHDALLRVWRAPNRFDGNRQMLRAYLLAAVRNESLAMLRSRVRREARERKSARLASPQNDDFAVTDAPLDPVETARLRAALERLPAAQREALERAYYGNLTHVEVAAELGAPLGTIKSRISMALRKLHEELADPQTSAR